MIKGIHHILFVIDALLMNEAINLHSTASFLLLYSIVGDLIYYYSVPIGLYLS